MSAAYAIEQLPFSSLRLLQRLASFALHALIGLALVIAVFPLARPRARNRLKRRWSRSLLAGLGVSLHASGRPGRASMLVANHVSWLDVLAINALAPATFVAKDELRCWPVAGTVIARSGNIFIRRRRLRDILRVNAELAVRMRRKERVAVFPEGTTTDGSAVAPFRNALLQPAIEEGLGVQPVAISFRDAAGRRLPEAGYHGDISFGESLLAIACSPGIIACVQFSPPLDTRGLCRRGAGAQARARIVELLANGIRPALRE